jgi:two-component system LytT family sensor kinase
MIYSVRRNTVLIIFLSAILLVVLYNFRLFHFYLEHMQNGGANIEHSKRFYGRMQVGSFNLVTEFIVFLIVTFFNYSWHERFTKSLQTLKWKIVYLIAGNLLLLFGFLLLEKFLHELLFDFEKWSFPETFYLILNLSVFILAITLANFLILYRKNKNSEIENIRLKEEKTRAELTALKEQISPHFFFNTLSTLSSIIRNEPKEEGLAFIQDMSGTYRYAIASGRKDLVQLREELDFIESYITLIKKRFGEKLGIEIDINEDYLSRELPPMSLQLLVENAIQHNVITQAKPLNIAIFVVEDHVVVQNNLQEKEKMESFGLGLKNLSNRFNLLAGKDIVIEKKAESFIVKLPLL